MDITLLVMAALPCLVATRTVESSNLHTWDILVRMTLPLFCTVVGYYYGLCYIKWTYVDPNMMVYM